MNLFDESKPEIVAMNKTQLANLYKIGPRTFNKWIKPFIAELGDIEGRYIFTPSQVKIIYERLGEP